MSTIQNEDVELRCLNREDVPVLARLANNRKIFEMVRDSMPYPYTNKDARAFIDFCSGQDPVANFGIDFRGELAGVAGLNLQNDIHRLTAEIGYWIGEPYWGRGIATKAVQQLTDYAFRDLGLVRLHTGVFDHNKASMRVLEKSGFSFEGIFRKSVIKDGIIRDEYRYSLINPES